MSVCQANRQTISGTRFSLQKMPRQITDAETSIGCCQSKTIRLWTRPQLPRREPIRSSEHRYLERVRWGPRRP